METMQAINTRRSIRKYKDKQVPKEMIEKILSAGMQAPSAGNSQSWEFIVVTDSKNKEKIPKFSPYAAMIKDAPLGILVCGDTKLERYKGFFVQDCSAATQNMLLTAHDMGLGAVWTGAYPMEDRVKGFRELFGIPEHVVPLGLVVIGWPDQTVKPENRYKVEKVHWEKW